MTTPAFLKFVDGGCQKPSFISDNDTTMQIIETFTPVVKDREYTFSIDADSTKVCLNLELTCSADVIAQLPIQLVDNGYNFMTIIVNGTDGKIAEAKRFITLKKGEHKLSFVFGDKVNINKVSVKR